MNMEGPASQGTDGPVPFIPGPWTIIRGDSVIRIVSTEGHHIASTDTKHYWQRHDDVDVANAHLISAAPEMFRMLQVINRIASPNPERTFDGIVRDLDMITDFARTGIAKALNQPLTAR